LASAFLQLRTIGLHRSYVRPFGAAHDRWP
jgi:hypothetical protein